MSQARQPAAPPAWESFAILWRIAAAFAAGLLLHAVFVFRFQPWAQRAHGGPSAVPLVAALAIAGLLLVWRAPDAAPWVPLALTLGLLAGNAVLIIVDRVKDPAAHNRWPFEMLMLLFFSGAAWLGSLAPRITGTHSTS